MCFTLHTLILEYNNLALSTYLDSLAYGVACLTTETKHASPQVPYLIWEVSLKRHNSIARIEAIAPMLSFFGFNASAVGFPRSLLSLLG